MRTPRRTTLREPRELLDLVGGELGVSEKHVVTQQEIDMFADVTGDHQWIHVDVERAKAGPFGGTVAHGFLTLALVPRLLEDILTVDAFSMGVNYGVDRVRFVKPLPPGTQFQGVAALVSAQPIAPGAGRGGGVQAKASVTVEFADDTTVCCAAEILFRYYL